MHPETKMKFIVLNLAMIFLFKFSSAQNHSTHFKSDIDFGNGIVISTFLDVITDKSEFTITSPKNADVRMMGGKARLGRMLGKSPKKGIIVNIKGLQQKDSLFGETKIPMFGKLKFRGVVKNNVLSGELLNKDAVTTGRIHGISTTENKIDYTQLYPKIIKTIEDNIYSTSALQNDEWKNFEKKLEKLSKVAHDDIEMYFGFNMLAPQLPFTHLYFVIQEDEAGNEEVEKDTTHQSVVFEEKNSTTAYLQIKNFSTSADELETILPGIVANTSYKNLIIDLRNNGGGGITAAFALAKYIVTEDMEVGYFPTNKLKYSGYQPEVFKTLPELQPVSTDDFGQQLKTSPGVKLIFKKPANPVYTGNIYVLTNGNTGSTCEPIVYALKSRKKAIIVGERTAGAMLSASAFVASGKYMLWVPVGDFYTHDGVRLDKVGVTPDIETKPEDALTKALEIISAGH